MDAIVHFKVGFVTLLYGGRHGANWKGLLGVGRGVLQLNGSSKNRCTSGRERGGSDTRETSEITAA